jgi:ABC-type multidrug transport system fused ATPase/permease subunit
MVILRDFNLSIPLGKTVTFVRPSGAGKSTIFNITLGLYPTNSGVIYIGDHLLNKQSSNRLRQSMSLVPQEAFLFSGTMLENILLGKLGASEQEIISAVKAANAHEFIEALPQGYETEVGGP